VYRVYCVHCQHGFLDADQLDTIHYDAMREHLRTCQHAEKAFPGLIPLGELIAHFRLQPRPSGARTDGG
jgi:hypothetical protein